MANVARLSSFSKIARKWKRNSFENLNIIFVELYGSSCTHPILLSQLRHSRYQVNLCVRILFADQDT